jgi:hypothetical protein
MIDGQYSSYCFLASELSIEKKIKYSRHAAYRQSMGFAINISHAPLNLPQYPGSNNYFSIPEENI